MSSPHNLSVGAASFVPSGSGAGSHHAAAPSNEDDFDEDYEEDEMMDELEVEMQNDATSDDINDLVATMGGSAVTTAPGVAAAAASSSLPAHLVSAAAEFWFPECRNCTCCNGYKHGCPCGGLCKCAGGTPSTSTISATAPGNNHSKPLCKFFQMGSCKFGSTCRFSHGS